MNSIVKKTANILVLLFVFSTFLFSQDAENATDAKTVEELPASEIVTKSSKVKKPKYSLKMLDYNIVGLKGIPLSSSQTSDESLSVMKGRSIVGLNFKPLIKSASSVQAVNDFFKNGSIFGFKLSGDIGKYVKTFKSESKSYGAITASYTFLVTARLGLEATVGYAGMDFKLSASKDGLNNFLIDQGITDIIAATDSFIRAKVFLVPATLSLKLYGKTRTAFNAFNIGITTFIYDVETKNGITGITTKQSVTDPAIYLSYEFGWQVELFPTKNWRVKPTLDISLIEIGYYVRPWAPNLYGSLANNFAAFGAGFDLGNLIPSWNSLPSFMKPLANIRFVLFPRIGFSLRF